MSNETSQGRAGDEAGGGGPLTLALDTATANRSVAVVRGAQVLALRRREGREAGASSVLLDVDEALREAGARLEDVGLFAAAKGPGSFTGIRAGLATLKALAKATGRPAVGVQTLEALAHQARPGRRLVALLPAGRGELFAQFLRAPAEGPVEAEGPPEHLSPAALLSRGLAAGGGLKWVAGCAQEFAAELARAAAAGGLRVRAAADASEEADGGEWLITEACGGLAVAVASLARLQAPDAGSGHGGLRPLYVRASDAELKEECRAPSL